MSWNRISRETIYSTPHVNVYEDKISLENGKIIDDYSVIEFKDGVVVVATDENGLLIAIDEYKYAVDKTLRSLPAGGIEDGDSPEQAGIRELREETGYEGSGAEIIGTYYSYPSKLPHVTHVIRISNAKKIHATAHEHAEVISEPTLLNFNKEVIGQFHASISVAALYRALDR